MSWHKEQLGFLTIAANTSNTDYLELAYVQALNVKATQKNNKFAVIVDTHTNSLVSDKHKKVFDYIVESPVSETGPYGLEPQAFWLSPFKETIKLESDLLFTGAIDHWLPAFRLRDVVLSSGCKNYQQQPATSRRYRKLFDVNDLPDTYSGLMYFRFSQVAADFFRKAQELFNNWGVVKSSLISCHDEHPTTDVVYALTAKLIGIEKCTLPSVDFINFVHMKPAINGFDESLNFNDAYVTEFDQGMIRINNVNQYHPVHYYNKNFVTEDMCDYYRSRIQ